MRERISTFNENKTRINDYDFYTEGYNISGWNGGMDSSLVSKYDVVKFDTWSRVETVIDGYDDFLHEFRRYLKMELRYYVSSREWDYKRKISCIFYVTKASAKRIKNIFDERNSSLDSKVDLINSYQNADVDIIANNCLSLIEDSYMLAPRIIQALHHKYSHTCDNSLVVFLSTAPTPKTKIEKQKQASDDNLTRILLDVSSIIDNFVGILSERENLSMEIHRAIAWRSIQRAAVTYYSHKWLEECGENLAMGPDDDLKAYVTNIVLHGDVDFTNAKNVSLLTYYIMSTCTQYATFPSTWNLLRDLITEVKSTLKTLDIREKLLTPQTRKSHNYSMADVDLMDGAEFEKFVAFLFGKMGYSTTTTKSSGDQGLDVIARRNDTVLGVQAKCYGGSVGNAAVQEAVAGKNYYGCNKVLVVTNNYFTSSAIDLAKVNNVILWDRKILKDKINEYLN